MKAEDYIKSLLPDFDRTRVMEDIRITTSEIQNFSIPMYHDADKFLGKHKFQSEVAKAKDAEFGVLVKSRGSMISTIYQSLQQASVNLAEVERLIERSYSEDIIGSGLTYLKAHLLQFSEAVNFVSRFSRRFLNMIYAAETATFEGEDTLEDAVTPADLEWINSNFQHFCNALLVVGRPVKEIEKSLAEIPDVVISKDASVVEAALGRGKTDPLKMGFIPVWLNPIYHIRMFYAEWQTNRYHAAKQEIKCLQLRKSHLESLQAGKPNARVQKEISYIEDRIQGYLRKNAEMEKRYG